MSSILANKRRVIGLKIAITLLVKSDQNRYYFTGGQPIGLRPLFFNCVEQMLLPCWLKKQTKTIDISVNCV